MKNMYNKDSFPTIGMVELTVSDLKNSLYFYLNVIGFKILERKENRAVLTADGKTALLILKKNKESIKRPNGTTGLFHFAILVPSRKDLALSLLHLAKLKNPLQGVSDHLYSEAIYLTDPDSNGIEIYADRSSDEWIDNGKNGYVVDTLPMDIEGVLSELGEETWNGLSGNTKIGHIHLQVSSIQESKEFYVHTLGFDVMTEDSRMLFISKDRYHHHIGLNTWFGVGIPKPPENALGLSYYTLHLTNEEVEEIKGKIKNLHYEYSVNENNILITDPSGNKIKIYHDKN